MNSKTTRYFFLLFSSIIMCLFSCTNRDKQTGADKKFRGKISVSGAFALYPLAVQWSEEFRKIHPHIKFDIQGGGTGKGMADVLSGTVDIAMASRNLNEVEKSKGALGIAVAIDAVVPTFNTGNPYASEIASRGFTKKKFKSLWMDGSVKTWGDVLGNGSREAVEVYTRSDAAGAPETWAHYLEGKQEDLTGTGVFGDPGVAEVVSKTKFAVGYNNVNYVYDSKTKKPFPGLGVIPIDLDENGTIDEGENFYGTLDELNAAIAEGKFPSPPARELLFVTNGRPAGFLVKEFLNWALTKGQESVASTGYVPLNDSLISTERKKIE